MAKQNDTTDNGPSLHVTATVEPKGRTRSPNRPFPAYSLKDAMRVASGVSDNNAGRPMNRILLAEAMDYTATGATFRDLITSAGKFGITKGSYAAEEIALTELGKKLVRPVSEDEYLEALRTAYRNIPLFDGLVNHFRNNKLPGSNMLRNLIEREPFNIDPAWSDEAVNVFLETGRFVGVVRETKGGLYVLPDSGLAPASNNESAPPQDEKAASILATAQLPNVATQNDPSISDKHDEISSVSSSEPPPARRNETQASITSQFFVAHGRDEKALHQLKDMLTKLTIPFVVAQDEANAGRPISEKIADLMRSCSGGIFIFSGDEELRDPSGQLVPRPRMNVVFELGAASLLYGKRVVIFKEKSVELPSDFRDIGYIEYERDQLSAKSMDLMMELIKLQALRLIPTSS